MDPLGDPTAPFDREPTDDATEVDTATDTDAERPVDDVSDGAVAAPLDAPFEAPTADLIDQLRSVELDDADER